MQQKRYSGNTGITLFDYDINMNDIENRVHEVLHNLNWLLEAHNSFVELVEIKGNTVVVRCTGACAECETNCVGVAFGERMPEIELVITT